MKTNLTPSVLGFILILFASACSTPTPTVAPLEIQTKPVAHFPPIIPTIEDLRLREYKWIVITEQNYEGTLMMLRDAGEEPVLYALTTTGYINLTANQADILKYIRQQREIIAVYQNSYLDGCC